MTSVDADLRSGRRLETGRRSESIIYTIRIQQQISNLVHTTPFWNNIHHYVTITEYLFHILQRIYSVCRNHNSVLFLFFFHDLSSFVLPVLHERCRWWGRSCLLYRDACVHPRFLVGFMLHNLYFRFLCSVSSIIEYLSQNANSLQ